MASGIYKLYWSNCDYFYYGQNVDLKNRHRLHLLHLRNKTHKNKKLESIYRKYGTPIFEILIYCDIQFLDENEQILINTYFGLKFCCNLSCSSEKVVWTNEMKLSVSNKNSGKNNDMFGKKISENTKKLQREKLSGENNYLSKWILNLEIGIYYPRLREAADTLGIDKRVLWQRMFKNKHRRSNFIYV